VLRQIGGWFLVVAGILVILAGVIAIAASYDPSTPDADSTRLSGWIFIGFGLVLAVPGILLIRSGRRIARAAPKQPGPAGRFTRLHLVGYSAAVLLGAAFGVGAIIFLICGGRMLRTVRQGRGLTLLTYLSIAWLLINWWPHDNLHRVIGFDFARLIWIEYGFHVTLIAAGACVVYFFVTTLRGMQAQMPAPAART
jgi:hypothetical protein